jgi:hypothetical protein
MIYQATFTDQEAAIVSELLSTHLRQGTAALDLHRDRPWFDAGNQAMHLAHVQRALHAVIRAVHGEECEF